MTTLSSGANTSVKPLEAVLQCLNLSEVAAKTPISGVCLDSRAIKQGELFLALKGANSDGRKFVDAAIKNGAAAVLVETDVDEHMSGAVEELKGNIPVIQVSNLGRCVSKIASNYFGNPSRDINVVGVTGTNGKSTCVSLISQALVLLGEDAASIGTLGYGLVKNEDSLENMTLRETGMTTPDAIACQRILKEMSDLGAEYAAMEVSSHGIAQSRVKNVHFKGAVFTNITRDHLDYHSSFEEYAQTKKSFFYNDDLDFIVVNIDDDHGEKIAQSSNTQKARCVTYSLNNSSADVYVKEVFYSSAGVTANILTPWGSGVLRSRLIGEFNLYNLLAVLATICLCGKDLQRVLKAICKLTPVRGRMERVVSDCGDTDIDIYIDYAHTPDALDNTLRTMRKLSRNKLWVVFGCGGDRDQGKRAEMGSVAYSQADCVVVTSDNPRSEDPQTIIDAVCDGIPSQEKTCCIVKRDEAIRFAIKNAKPGDSVLIAGKGHEEYQIIETERVSFSDFEVALSAVNERKQAEVMSC